MCGRYVLTADGSDLVEWFGVGTVDDDLPGPSYNITPSQRVVIVAETGSGRSLSTVGGPPDPPVRRLLGARWGLVPPFAKSLTDGPTPFNARSEKLMTSGLYRAPYARRRAIVPASGFYERRRTGDRQSYYIHPADGVLGLAGLYDWWRVPGLADDDPARWLLSATIVTRDAGGRMAPIHDREPLYLPPDLWADWLDPATPGGPELLAMALDAGRTVADALDFTPVGPGWLSTRPGSYRDDPELLTPVPPVAPTDDQMALPQ